MFHALPRRNTHAATENVPERVGAREVRGARARRYLIPIASSSAVFFSLPRLLSATFDSRVVALYERKLFSSRAITLYDGRAIIVENI